MIHSPRGTRALLALALSAGVSSAAPADQPPPPEQPVCREAVVSPVSGHAECVNPRGAPVEQPHRKDMVCGRAKPDEPVRCPDQPPQNAAPR